MRRMSLTLRIAFAAAVTVTAAHAQTATPVFGGLQAFQHSARVVLGAGKLVGVHGDSVSQVVVSSKGAWLIGSRACVASFCAPLGSTCAFGTSAVLARSYQSTTFDALAIGDPGANNGAGAVYVYFGAPLPDSTPALVLHGENPGDLFGASLANVGDMNGDGFHELLVGAPGRQSGTGAAFVYLGGTAPPISSSSRTTGSGAGELFGASVVAVGDLDADGKADFAVGAPGSAEGRGKVVVVLATGQQLQVLQDPVANATYGERARFGATLASGGDWTGDGHADLLVGAPGAGKGRGAAYLFAGAPSSFAASPIAITGTEVGDRFGSSLVLGNLRDPSLIEAAIGSPGADEGHGVVEVFHGGAGADLLPDLRLEGLAPDDQFGASIGIASIYPRAIAQQLLLGAPMADGAAPSAGAAWFIALPPATAVENSTVAIESDGLPLLQGQFTTTEPTLVLRLVGAKGLDVHAADIALDGAAVPQATLIPRADGALTAHLAGLVEGPHVLTARLVDQGGALAGSAQIQFMAAKRLRVEGVRVTPNPTRGSARLEFVLTRPARYELALYDIAGRRTSSVERAVSVPGVNSIRFGDARPGGSTPPGIYFYVLSAQYLGQRTEARGRVVVLP